MDHDGADIVIQPMFKVTGCKARTIQKVMYCLIGKCKGSILKLGKATKCHLWIIVLELKAAFNMSCDAMHVRRSSMSPGNVSSFCG